MITQAELKKLLDYNSETGVFTWKVSPARQVFSGDIAGTKRKDGYIQIKVKNKLILSHRLAWIYMYGYLPKYIDHINGQRDDNRIINIRKVSNQQNSLNSKISKNNTSGIKGVYWDKSRNKWTVRLSIDGKCKFFKRFDDIDLAKLVIEEVRNKYHGKYANHG
jgi:hypothetical protein